MTDEREQQVMRNAKAVSWYRSVEDSIANHPSSATHAGHDPDRSPTFGWRVLAGCMATFCVGMPAPQCFEFEAGCRDACARGGRPRRCHGRRES